MSKQGSATNTSNSASGLVSTLIPTLLVALVYFAIFLVLRRSQRRFYAPRTYIGSLRESQRTPSLPGGLLNWFGSFWKIPDTWALEHQSLDAYLFLRFLKVSIAICFVGCCITWPILFPVNATGGGGAEQLDILSYSNIDNSGSGVNRYYAHVFTAWIYYGFVLYLIFRECVFYVNIRQAFLISPLYSDRVSSRTVLFTSVPTAYLDEHKIRKVFGSAVKHVWIQGDTKQLTKEVEKRDKFAYKLEKAEVKLIKAANKERTKDNKGGASHDSVEKTSHRDTESGSVAARYVPNKKRPSHRTGLLGLIGSKVDSINWYRSELERMIPEVDGQQRKYLSGDYKKNPAVFIEFSTQSAAETAYQTLAHHQALHMAPRYIGVTPQDVIWKSLGMPWWRKLLVGYAVKGFIAALIIFWAIPVAVVGVISNINNLETISFLTWISKIPPVILGVVTGLLPSVMLAILMSLVPVIMRLCAKLSGEPSYSRVELFTQNAYFAFQVVQVFLITTLSSSASAVGAQIAANPASATTILAQSLPKASNFYISYFLVQGLTIAASVISQVIGFAIFNLLYKYLAGTPRALYSKWTKLSALSWGSLLPVYTCIVVIAITYAAIAPLVLGFATLALSLFYLAWRYNILFVTDTNIDTRGLIYPRAIKHLLTGVYLSVICMIGLFGASTAYGPLVLMVFFLVILILFHISLNNALAPVLYNLPQSLMAEEESRRVDLEAAQGKDPQADAREKQNGTNGNHATNGNGTLVPNTASQLEKKQGSRLQRFLKPWIYADYPTLRHHVPHYENFSFALPEKVESEAYYPPAVLASPPLLWIPRDQAGVSAQEVAHTSKVIPITDEGSTLSEKGKIEWDQEGGRPPIWEEEHIY